VPSINELMSQIPIGQLAARLGLSESETEAAVSQALPALVSGMAANAQDPGGAASLSQALGEHDDDLLEGGIDLDQVNSADGEKIVRNVFGQNQESVVDQLANTAGLGVGAFSTLLPMLAPLVMSFLAKSRSGSDDDSGGGLGDMLGGLLGGSQGGGGGLGDLLGGLLGGGKR